MDNIINEAPCMVGPNLLRKIELTWLQEALNLSVRAEAASFLRENIKQRTDSGLYRFVLTKKTRIQRVKTAVGTVRCSVPIINNRAPKALPLVEYKSKVLPNHMTTKLSYDASLAWRFIEGLATGDFADAKDHLMDVFTGCNKKRLSHWLSRTFMARYDKWLKRDLSRLSYHAIWLDKVQIRQRGPHKDLRLYVAAALTITGPCKLLGVYRAPDDVLGWSGLIHDLKARGLPSMSVVTGALCPIAIIAILARYKNFKPSRPDKKLLRESLASIPRKRQELAKTIFDTILQTKDPYMVDSLVALFVQNYLISDPKVTFNLLDPVYFLAVFNRNLAER
ncbi:MAG: transposase [Deltaproteobacteria bacterium]|jgi:hypothetical protein|nr:transposase [Deltaproteobacteria bacterium]